jgi:hypothetical protein
MMKLFTQVMEVVVFAFMVYLTLNVVEWWLR